MVLSVPRWHAISSRAKEDVWRMEERLAEHTPAQTHDKQGWEMIKNRDN